MKEIEARWNPAFKSVVVVQSVVVGRGVGMALKLILARQSAEQLMEELRVALIDSEEPLPEFSPVRL